MSYNEKVLDHYENPRNVGTLDKNDDNVGTGLVGAPSCFGADTLIAIADGNRYKTIKELYDLNKIIPVWSFNIQNKIFEIKNAKIIKTGSKPMDKVYLNDEGFVIATPDHKFLLRPSLEYIENKEIDNQSIYPFKRYISKRGYWTVRQSKNIDEYREIFRFHDKTILKNGNIHHVDENKQNDIMDNLKLISITDHAKYHKPNFQNPKKYDIEVSKSSIVNVLNKSYNRAEVANMLNITTEELYFFIIKYGIHEKKRHKNSDEIKEEISLRMKKNNPYHKFTDIQKLQFATHKGSDNGRWINISDEELVQIGRKLYEINNKITAKIWSDYAKENGLPQNPVNRFGSWENLKEQILNYNHKIIKREYFGIEDAYTLQVEENNNFIVLSRITKNIQEGIVVKNCGDVMRLQIKVNDEGIIEDAKFKTFGCGSALAASSLVTEWVKGKSVEFAETIKNSSIVEELSLPPVKVHCSVLGVDAIRAAVSDWKQKQLKIKEKI